MARCSATKSKTAPCQLTGCVRELCNAASSQPLDHQHQTGDVRHFTGKPYLDSFPLQLPIRLVLRCAQLPEMGM